MIIIGLIFLLLIWLAITQRKLGELDDKQMARNILNLVDAIDEIRKK
jgi:hypothetical protein